MTHSISKKSRANINWIIFLVLIAFVSVFILMPIWQPGIIVGGDYIFPYTNSQLGEFYKMGNLAWSYDKTPLGSQIEHNNLFPIHLFSGIFYFFGLSGIVFQKVLLTIIVLTACISSYILLLRISRQNFAALIGSFIFIFSPIFYNYFSMGWVWVLLFMALLPLKLILIQEYFENNKYSAIIMLGLLTSISFAQSQVIFWTPLILVFYAISFTFDRSQSHIYILKKTIIALLIVILSVSITHISWILPLIIDAFNSEPSTLLKGISSYDNARFNSTTLHDLVRGWGSIFNSQYEIAYSSKLEFLTFLPPIIVATQFFFKDSALLKYKIFSLLLVLTPFFFFAFKDILIYIPFMSIIRDLNRFIVLLQFGFAISISIFFAQKQIKPFLKVILSILLLCLAHPFISGSLFDWSIEQGKGQSVRHLEIPQNQVEEILKKYNGQKNLLLPTGGHIGTINNPLFKNSFSELADFDSYYSPFASGIYTSDKSTEIESKFAKYFIEGSMNSDGKKTSTIMTLYGIDNVFMRTNLFSTYNREFNYRYANYPFCENVEYINNYSDFSINRICSVDEVYPLIFAPTNIQYSEDDDFINEIELQEGKRFAVVEPLGTTNLKELVDFLSDGDMKTPKTSFIEQDIYRYLVSVNNIETDYFIVLNQSIHSGWKIFDVENRKELPFNKVLVNGFVNGWIIPKVDGVDLQKFIIEYRPQFTYLYIRNISLIILFFSLLISLYFLYIIKSFKQKS
jgi:hypothetical protein